MVGMDAVRFQISGCRFQVVTKDVEPWTVVGGNPAKFIKKRELKCELFKNMRGGML